MTESQDTITGAEKYLYPTLDLLRETESDERSVVDTAKLLESKNRVVDTLRNLGVDISSIAVTVGPRITLYEITLAPWVSLSMLRGLEEELALSLHSCNVRFVIPKSQKGTIGIEVPNVNESPIIPSLGNIFKTTKFQETEMELPCAIGRTMTNEVFMFDLTKARNVLIAGSTGQGKSTAVNAMIMSLLFKKHPVELKFVLMDSYEVEFGMYAQIANHFLASIPNGQIVITKSDQCVRTLESLCMEMDARYFLLKKAYVRNVNEYNKEYMEGLLNPVDGHIYLPYIVVVIDEYGDFIEEKGRYFETPLIRLAQRSSIVGIHLIISTRRPLNNIVTEAIKTNFPTRIAFRMPERIFSQVILDSDGAEVLLGNGDMLFRAGNSMNCIRIQGAFVDTCEIKQINQFISQQHSWRCSYPYTLPEPDYDDNVNFDLHTVDI